MTPRLEDMVSSLGGERLLGARLIRSELDFDVLIHEGVPVAALEHMIGALVATQRAILDGLGIAPSTVRRRKRGEKRRLGLVESERTVRLGRIAAIGNDILGSVPAVGQWLLRPNLALAGAEPISLLQTDVGAREVEAVLIRALLGYS
jgi:putative toxin-antitoxin system antitoxin component (TIGR02293 family)